ncbi:MAG: phosphate acyltransferase PlsX [Campylobacteraceae bacterium]|jgi:glycerol-3-phosphate acyltransferase PlsX|nr:phosphate acyltransferase PlsX [Campylobacteraceae bacterium]
MLKIAIDAMGGDLGFAPIIEGVIKALAERDNFEVILVGKTDAIKPLFSPSMQSRVSYIEADDVFDMHESATDVLKRKESTIYKAVDLVREGKADAVVSAGHSGATMSLATLRIGRLKGVSRPAIATLMPTVQNGVSTLVLDVGANVDCKAEHLFQFAVMGECYAKNVMGVRKPKIGLLSNGEESSKGNDITKEAYEMMAKLNSFVGNIEGNNIFDASVNVVVCDGFVGNIVLKTSEGVAESITNIIKMNIKKSPLAIAGAALMRKVFKILKKQVDYAEYGGAPLMGVKKCVIISHGKSNAKAIKNAVFQALKFADSHVTQAIEEEIAEFE